MELVSNGYGVTQWLWCVTAPLSPRRLASPPVTWDGVGE
jgi:hypothetical protein